MQARQNSDFIIKKSHVHSNGDVSSNHYNLLEPATEGDPSKSWDEIFHARKMFHEGENPQLNSVSPHILRSWKRSKKAHVSHHSFPMRLLNGDKFSKTLKENALLIDVAQAVIDKLLEEIIPAKNCIILTDAEGIYLYTIGGSDGFGSGPTCPIRGLISREAIDGTTSMGICLEERVAASVLGCEHYNPHYDGWSCATAPIFNQDNVFVGTLTLTLERDKFHYHTFSLVTAAAKTISDGLRLLHIHQQTQTVMGLLGEAVIILNQDGMIKKANRHAGKLFRIQGEAQGKKISDIISKPDPNRVFLKQRCLDNQEHLLHLTDGTPVRCCISSSQTPDGEWCFSIRELKHDTGNSSQAPRPPRYDFSCIIGDSAPMQEAMELARLAAENNMPTLILGESGVGKELFAQAIHHDGIRQARPFVAVNCGAIPRDLVQSELFGYEPGAFTGAGNRGAPGKFELANGGTIFLDEIGDMPLDAQASLLRVLQEGEVTRIGGKRPIHIDVRVISATNHPLEQAVKEGRFRRDLYYRLHVIAIPVPPLRFRPEDIMLLAAHFLRKTAQQIGNQLTGFTPDAARALQLYPWPGNVRELENMVKRAAVVASGPAITSKDLPPELVPRESRPHCAPSPQSTTSKKQTDDAVHELISALRTTSGNVQAAAKTLGVSRVTLYARIRKHGIDLRALRMEADEQV